MLDQVVEWFEPEDRPGWMTAGECEVPPATLAGRELRPEVGRPGFRARRATLVTTLPDAEAYPPDALAGPHGAPAGGAGPETLEDDDEDGRPEVRGRRGGLEELTAHAIAYDPARVVMVEAA